MIANGRKLKVINDWHNYVFCWRRIFLTEGTCILAYSVDKRRVWKEYDFAVPFVVTLLAETVHVKSYRQWWLGNVWYIVHPPAAWPRTGTVLCPTARRCWGSDENGSETSCSTRHAWSASAPSRERKCYCRLRRHQNRNQNRHPTDVIFLIVLTWIIMYTHTHTLPSWNNRHIKQQRIECFTL